MKLLNIYEDRDDAEKALESITGEKRLASERDSTVVIYNLFGQPTWGNFYRLDMFQLHELQQLLDQRQNGSQFDENKHREILTTLKYVANRFGISIPTHSL